MLQDTQKSQQLKVLRLQPPRLVLLRQIRRLFYLMQEVHTVRIVCLGSGSAGICSYNVVAVCVVNIMTAHGILLVMLSHALSKCQQTCNC